MKKYLIGITIISLFLIAIAPLKDSLPFELHDLYIEMVIFYIAQSVVIAFILSQGEKQPDKLPIFALGSIVFRLLTAVVFLIAVFIIGVENVKLLSIQFMAIYLLFLVFELTVVLTNLRRN
jgi:hypothetical protein